MASGEFTDPTMTHGLEVHSRGWVPWMAYPSLATAQDAAERLILATGRPVRILELASGRIVG